MWHMIKGKRQITEGIELPKQEKIKMLGEKETFKYLGISEVGTIKKEMKEKIKQEYFGRTRKLLETKLYSTNFKGINTWAISS